MIACVHRWCGACCEGDPLIISPPSRFTSDCQTSRISVKPDPYIIDTIKIRTDITQQTPNLFPYLLLSRFVIVLVCFRFVLVGLLCYHDQALASLPGRPTSSSIAGLTFDLVILRQC